MSRARRRRERVLEHLTELREMPLGGGPAPAFRERLRAELASGGLAERPEPAGRVSGVTTGAHRRPSRRRSLLSQLAAVGLAGAMMVSSFATYQAVPGDTLYPLKRAAESTFVHLSADDAERGQRELTSAETRAKEVASLLGSSSGGPLIGRTLKDMEKSTRVGIERLERVEPRSPKIKKFAEKQKETVKPMLQELDDSQLAQAQDYLDYIDGLVPPE
ncbi:DUF5667 domain-containing protein [Nonomuraea aridisoli]|uniref:DUF5667 domain-containing protein n=1 Tax=Nonomuraea aridisoli TaxID=2070368 RepID=A0A2W2FMF2_9ACTN|nr:DUF5667 domain-containing protein [Nonomuraea aridisoli]PZG22977.1 hypothetical protein C1J01_02425 [Nonomuraea aridisoli]